MHDHDLFMSFSPKEILYEHRPVLDRAGEPVEGLHNVWITLNNPKELNSYTTDAVKEVILAFRKASNDRAAVAVIFTGAGDRAFCAGGNTREYAEVYAGAPAEYRQYMRLFNDMVTAILHLRQAGDLPCQRHARRRWSGDRHGLRLLDRQRSGALQPGGPEARLGPRRWFSTDFLPLFVGIEAAMYSGTLCEPWSAHRFYRLGGLTDVVPALKVDGEWVANPLVITDRLLDQHGRVVLGDFKTGERRQEGKEICWPGVRSICHCLDEAVDAMSTKLLYTMPDCLTKTIESLRKHKLEHWDRNRETNRAWLALNMMTEANAGFRAFHYGDKRQREADFVLLRQRLAEGARHGATT